MREMARHLGDLAAHLLRHPPVAQVALRQAAQLDQVHGLAGVQHEGEADAVGHRDRIRGGRGNRGLQVCMEIGAGALDGGELLHRAGGEHVGGHLIAQVRAQWLVLDGEQAMALKVPVGAVVADDLKGVAGGLHRPSGTVSTILALADDGREGLGPGGPGHRADGGADRIEAAATRRPERMGDDALLAVGVELEQPHRGLRRGPLGRTQERARRLGGARLNRRQIGAVHGTAVGPVDPREEGGDDLAKLAEHHRRAGPRLGQGVGEHPHEHRLVGLARGEDADVRARGRREEPAQRVERSGAHRAGAGCRRCRRVAGGHAVGVGDESGQQLGIGPEGPVEGREVAWPELGVVEDRRRPVVAVAPARPVVVGDVAGGLLQVARQSPMLDDLGEEVRCPLHGDVGGAQLSHRVVSVLGEDPPEERLGLGASRSFLVYRTAVVVGEELLEQDAPERLRAAGVAGEERPLDLLRQSREGEDRPDGVGDVGGDPLPLVGAQVILGDPGRVAGIGCAHAPLPSARSAAGG